MLRAASAGSRRDQEGQILTLLSQPGLNIAYWAFNTQKPPFDKKEVRQAFNMAIDKAAIIKDVYSGAGQAAKNLIPPTIWSYNDKVKDYPYDPEKAKAMLKAAGVTTPLDIDLWYMPVQRPYNPNAKRIAEMMQSDLDKIGVNAKLVTYEWGEYRKRAAGRRAYDGPARLDGRQWRSRQLLLPAGLRGGARRRAEHHPVVQQGIRRQARQGTPDDRREDPHQAL